MKENVYIFGHQNPDTDSICSAISYSYLKNQIDKEHNYIPVALKEVNKETEYILNRFNVDEPKLVTSLKPQVTDINLYNELFVKETDSIRKTLEILLSQAGRILPVVDNNERLIGIVSISDIVHRILSVENKTILRDTKTPFSNIINDLHLKELFNFYNKENGSGNVEGIVYLSTDLVNNEQLQNVTHHDIIICNYIEWKKYIHYAGGVIIGGIDNEVKEQKLKKECENYINQLNIYENHEDLKENEEHEERFIGSMFYSAKCTLELVKALAQATPINSMVIKEGLQYFVTYETIEDVRKNMMTSKFRRFPVVDSNGKIKGMISRSDLLDINKKKAILVDHNERGQSIDGIEDIDILEIIDHHRVADVQTIAPLYFRVEPVGCTCTIVGRIFEEQQIEIPKDIAGLMLSAIISDTLLFNSPTCTKADVDMAYKLAEIANVNTKMYGMKMITQGSILKEQTPNQILNNDRKKFMFGKYKVTISQVNTGDFDGFFSVFESTLEEMERICEVDGYNLFVLLVTDAVVGGTEIIPIGDARWIVEEAYNMKAPDKSMFLSGVFSRKKQVVPMLMNAAQL